MRGGGHRGGHPARPWIQGRAAGLSRVGGSNQPSGAWCPGKPVGQVSGTAGRRVGPQCLEGGWPARRGPGAHRCLPVTSADRSLKLRQSLPPVGRVGLECPSLTCQQGHVCRTYPYPGFCRCCGGRWGGRGRDHRTILPVCWCIDSIWRNVNFNIF